MGTDVTDYVHNHVDDTNTPWFILESHGWLGLALTSHHMTKHNEVVRQQAMSAYWNQNSFLMKPLNLLDFHICNLVAMVPRLGCSCTKEVWYIHSNPYIKVCFVLEENDWPNLAAPLECTWISCHGLSTHTILIATQTAQDLTSVTNGARQSSLPNGCKVMQYTLFRMPTA